MNGKDGDDEWSLDAESFKEEVFALRIEADESGVATEDIAKALSLVLFSLFSDDEQDYRIDDELR